MLFNSFSFLLLFLPVTLFIALQLRGSWLLAWITISSYGFYAVAGQPWFLLPMLVTTTLDYFLAIRLAGSETSFQRRALLAFSLICNLGLLFYFKYGQFMARTFGIQASWLDVVLPAGISFYTFQTMSYMIDVYRKQAQPEHNFWKFASFVSFFPHLVAGPMTRHHQLFPGLTTIAERGISPWWASGIYLFCIGLCKKVLIADRVGNLIDPLLGNIPAMGSIDAWLALLGYAVQIYFDFSGYSDMAIGLGRLFGIELPQNFNRPYTAMNPRDFWNRWHITLSRWLRDYLYISLGGNRLGSSRQMVNLLITMWLGGLWHGANWTFAVWGLYHGVWLVIYHIGRRFWDAQAVFVQRTVTFFVVVIGWAFFRASNLHDAAAWLSQAWKGEWKTTLPAGSCVALGSLIAIALLIEWALPTGSAYDGFERWPAPRQIVLGSLTVAALVWMSYSSRFLYFQF